ncbi:MAG: nicotinate (nicotinamide) nucleotide adenylyltransferase [Verrucomicrobiota bacterium]
MTAPIAKARIALFGGTFDPPHLGHLEMAKRAREIAALDEVIFIPCRQSPHKSARPTAEDHHRLAMLERATHDLPWATVSKIELDRPDPSYSWQTAETFSLSNPEADLFWILGHDQWQSIDSWAEPDKLRSLLTFIVCAREHRQGDPRDGFRARFVDFHHPASASTIRERLAAGDPSSATALLPSEVAAYIADQGLYQP